MNRLSKVLFLILVFSFLAIPLLFSLEVNKSELESGTNNGTIEFINYSGPHSVINTRDQIKGIGSSIADDLIKSDSATGSYGNAPKYQVIHVVDPTVNKGLDADILILGKDAGVDHIRNLRWIIAAYISTAYNYSDTDAQTLATFITVYNAVYRGKLDTFTAKYKPAVVSYLSATNVGLSINYVDWPGKTQIVIPLYDPNGGLSTIDTSVISDKAVVSSMQDDEDKNIDVRKDMVDLKEREADEASENAIESQKEAVEAHKEAVEAQSQAVEAQKQAEIEEQKLAEVQTQAAEAQQKAEEAQQIAEENPDDVEAQQKAVEAVVEAEQKQEEVEQQEETTIQAQQEAVTQQQIAEEKQEQAEQASEESAQNQQLADKKLSESQAERVEIAKDQKTVIEETEKASSIVTAYGLKLIDEKELLSSMVSVNAETGEVINNSPVNVIRGRTIIPTGSNFAAVAGTSGVSTNDTIRLVIIDNSNMEIIIESAEQVSPSSVLVQDGTNFLVVINEDNSYYVARYDNTLKLLNKSTVAVLSSTPIFITSNGIFVTGSDNTVKLLNSSDLSLISAKQ